MRSILILFMMYSLPAYPGSSIEVMAYINGATKDIGIQSSVYGDVIGVLSTCSRYGEFITDVSDLEASYRKYDFEAARSRLKEIKKKNHLKISYKDGSIRLPTSGARVAVEEIYVGFTEPASYPIIVTSGDGLIYRYSKCSGYLLTEHFVCNAVINEMFKLEHKNSFCKNH